MDWDDFIWSYEEWSESTIRSRISSLTDIGDGCDIVSVVMDLPTDKLKNELVRKAIQLKASFEYDDFQMLDGEISSEVFNELKAYTGYDENIIPIDENNLMWEDFYENWTDWNNDELKRRITKLKTFGNTAEVCETILCMPSTDYEELLYNKAIEKGVRFTYEQLERMDKINEEAEEFEETAPRGLGFFGTLLLLAPGWLRVLPVMEKIKSKVPAAMAIVPTARLIMDIDMADGITDIIINMVDNEAETVE